MAAKGTPIVTPSVGGVPKVGSSPKARFQAVKGNVSAHFDLIDNPAFDRAADFAMLQMSENETAAFPQQTDAMASGYRIQGAKRFLDIFKKLAYPKEEAPVRPDLDNLK